MAQPRVHTAVLLRELEEVLRVALIVRPQHPVQVGHLDALCLGKRTVEQGRGVHRWELPEVAGD